MKVEEKNEKNAEKIEEIKLESMIKYDIISTLKGE